MGKSSVWLTVVMIAATLAACAGSGKSWSHDDKTSSKGRKHASSQDSSATAHAESDKAATRSLNGLDPSHTRVVVGGVLEWQHSRLSSFSPRHRKDEELAKTLTQTNGLPKERITLLLDKAVTRDAYLKAVKVAAEKSAAGDLLIVYYAGHGVRNDDGKTYLANYDIDVANPEATGVSMADLAKAISGAAPKGTRVLLLADCCYSGALREAAADLEKAGYSAASVTSADASNSSTGNWTYSQAVIDALRGASLSDRDKDGTIELSELAIEVADAMKFREGQRSGYKLAGIDGDLAIAPAQAGPHVGDAGNGAFMLGSYATLRDKQAVARIVGADKAGLVARLYDYSDATDITVDANQLAPITYEQYKKGDDISVLWSKKPYDAKVLETDGDFMLITYPGWPSIYDEWVLSTRVVADKASGAKAAGGNAKTGDSVQVEWNGSWYPAKIIEKKGKKLKVHYDGYDDAFDEWVPSNRVR